MSPRTRFIAENVDSALLRQRPYVNVAVLHELETGDLLVGVSPVHMFSFHETDENHTTFRFHDGATLTVEEDFYTVLHVFNEGQREAPPRRPKRL